MLGSCLQSCCNGWFEPKSCNRMELPSGGAGRGHGCRVCALFSCAYLLLLLLTFTSTIYLLLTKCGSNLLLCLVSLIPSHTTLNTINNFGFSAGVKVSFLFLNLLKIELFPNITTNIHNNYLTLFCFLLHWEIKKLSEKRTDRF